jgi:hypothetical protein
MRGLFAGRTGSSTLSGMSASPQPTRDRRRPGLRRGLIGAAVPAAVLVLAGLFWFTGGSRDDAEPAAGGRGGAATVTDQIADRLTAILETSTPEQHTGHGHNLGEDPGRVLCEVEVFGYEPAGAAAVSEVKRVYGYHLCAVATAGRSWDFAPKLVGPIVVDLTEPPAVNVVQGGPGYRDRIRRAMGERYVERAVYGISEDAADRLRSRYQAETARR